MATVVHLPRDERFGNALSDSFLIGLVKARQKKQEDERLLQARNELTELLKNPDATRSEITRAALDAGESLSSASSLATTFETKRTDTEFDKAVAQLDPEATPDETYKALQGIDPGRADQLRDNMLSTIVEARQALTAKQAEARAITGEVRAIEDQLFDQAAERRAQDTAVRQAKKAERDARRLKLAEDTALRQAETLRLAQAAAGKLTPKQEDQRNLLEAHGMVVNEGNMKHAARTLRESDKVNLQLQKIFRKQVEDRIVSQSFVDEIQLTFAQRNVRGFMLRGKTREDALEQAVFQAKADFLSGIWLPPDIQSDPDPVPRVAAYMASQGAGNDTIAEFLIDNAKMHGSFQLLFNAMAQIGGADEDFDSTDVNKIFKHGLMISIARWTDSVVPLTNFPFSRP